MAYSGTVAQTVFNTRRVIENAARRCKLPAQSLTAEHVDIAKDQLYILLSDLPNRGVQLWCVQKELYPLYDGVPQVVTTAGTVDVLNSNLRTIQTPAGTHSTAAAYHQIQFTSATAISTIGVRWSGAAVGIELQRSVDGVSWTTIQSETPSASAGQTSWFDLDAVVAAPYFQVYAPGGSLPASDAVFANSPTEIPLARMNRDDYTNLPNKTFKSNRPLQYWFDRQAAAPIMRLWPMPNSQAEAYQLVVWVQRHIMDVGSMTQEIEVPQRWYEAIVAMLAAKLALEFVEVDPGMIPVLEAKADRALYFAQQEERDNSPVTILPNISMYTA